MPAQIRNKSYGYTLYTFDGEKIRGHISAPKEEMVKLTLEGMKKARGNVQFYTVDSLDLPCDYTWNDELDMWQTRLL
jgi:hypothetical protein